MGELALTALEASFNLTPGVGSAQLAKQHGDKLTPAGQAFAAMLGACGFDDTLEVIAGYELEYLAEHAA